MSQISDSGSDSIQTIAADMVIGVTRAGWHNSARRTADGGQSEILKPPSGVPCFQPCMLNDESGVAVERGRSI
jgi:hypothetical protein